MSEKADEKAGEKTLPPVDFISFILSLTASAQINMGLVPDPMTHKSERNLEMAKQTIDLLGLLEEKTKGNLTEEEQKVFDEILHHLRLQFLEAKK